MHSAKFIYFVFILLLSINCFSKEVGCLDNLGGGRSDVDCYTNLLKQQNDKNKITLDKITKKLPQSRKEITTQILKEHEDISIRYCEIIKIASNDWEDLKPDGMSEHRFSDVMYRKCLYDQSVNFGNQLEKI